MTASIPSTVDLEFCATLDAADPLRDFRERFDVDDDVIYLDGNSLGRPPRAAAQRIATVVNAEWARGLIRSWSDAGWMEASQRVGDKLARLIGAAKGEVLVTDSTSVALFKLIAAVLQARPQRRVIVSERENFPTDRYVASGLATLLGSSAQLRLVERDQLIDVLDQQTALLMLTHVDFRSGAVHDMSGLTAAAHRCGALALWDLSHSTGAVTVDVQQAEADLAVGCGYKYLNGGPGAPAYLYVGRHLHDELRNPIQGWMGHVDPFAFAPDYEPAPGIRSWLSGTPPVIALAALEVAVDLMLEADQRQLVEKARALTDLFIRLADTRLARFGFELISPRDANHRGAQVSLRHGEGFRVIRALIDRGVIGDFRDPDVCRFGFAPLYTRFVDVWNAVERAVEVMDSGLHRDEKYAVRSLVT